MVFKHLLALRREVSSSEGAICFCLNVYIILRNGATRTSILKVRTPNDTRI